VLAAPAALALMLKAGKAGAMSPDLEAMLSPAACNIQAGAGKVPFICFDLSGGANLNGSEILIGRNNPTDFLSTQGYAKLGLPGNMTPGSANAAARLTTSSTRSSARPGTPTARSCAACRRPRRWRRAPT
jgi:hypothetical protein